MKSLKLVTFFIFILFCSQILLAQGIITTVAGIPNQNGYNGDGISATTAKLFGPNGVAVDASGNFFIADLANNRIRRVSITTGIISTIAGNGSQGFSGDGGLATSASLNYPNSVAVDQNGNVYFSELNNRRIRKIIKSTGIIVTIAGTGFAGYNGDNITATSANLSDANGVAVDGFGNIFIAETGTERIRKVSSNGIISTIAGTGTSGFSGDGGLAISSELNNPNSVAFDGFNNFLFIGDRGNNRIRKIDLNTGIITTVVGTGIAGFTGDKGVATSAQINGSAICVDKLGNLYLGDDGNYRVRVVKNGIIRTIAGIGTNGLGGDGGNSLLAEFSTITGLAISNSDYLYVTESASRVRRIAPSILSIKSVTPSIGCPGTAFNVIGTGFSGQPAISMNGSAPTGYSIINDTLITATVASGAKTGYIDLTLGGTTVLSSTLFYVGKNQTAYAYAVNSGSNNISVINTNTNGIVTTIPVAGSLAFSPDGSTLYVSNNTKIFVVNTFSNLVIDSITGLSGANRMRVSPYGFKLYVCTNGGISIFNTKNNSYIGFINLGSLTIPDLAITNDGVHIYASTWDQNSVVVINTQTYSIEKTIKVGNYPFGIVISPDNNKVYSANQLSNSVSVIDVKTNTVVGSINAGSIPASLCISSNGEKIYVVNDTYNGTVSIINTVSSILEKSISVGHFPVGISITPNDSTVFVENVNSATSSFVQGTISVIDTYNKLLTNTITTGLGTTSVGNFITNVTSPCTTLPLHLTTFTATYQNKQSVLDWSTTNEINFANFIVERSHNGISFSQVGFVNPKGNINNGYRFLDNTPTEASTLYYRLKMIDKDGSFTFSPTVQVVIPSSTKGIILAPNPASNNSTTVYFKQSVTVGTVSVYNALGIKVLNHKFCGALRNNFVLSTASLPAGTYIINVKTPTDTYSNKLQIVR